MIDLDSHCFFLRFAHLFLAVLGLCLCCCVRASSSCESRGYSLAVVLGFLLLWSTGSTCTDFSSRDAWAQKLQSSGSRVLSQ